MSEELDLCLKRVTINSRNDMGVAHLQDFAINMHYTYCMAWSAFPSMGTSAGTTVIIR